MGFKGGAPVVLEAVLDVPKGLFIDTKAEEAEAKCGLAISVCWVWAECRGGSDDSHSVPYVPSQLI